MPVEAAHKMGLMNFDLVEGAEEPKMQRPEGPDMKLEGMQAAHVLRALGFMRMERI